MNAKKAKFMRKWVRNNYSGDDYEVVYKHLKKMLRYTRRFASHGG